MRQVTAQLEIFGDGVPRIKPLLAFHGKGVRIAQKEKAKWDKRVAVDFETNAWVDETVILDWLKRQWSSASVYGIYSDKPRMIVMDFHRAQKTEKVKSTLRTQHTTIATIHPGCTSLVQPLGVVVNAPFKRKVEDYAEQHYEANITNWMNDKYTPPERRVLMTKWVADAWTHICTTQTDAIVRIPCLFFERLCLPDYPYLYYKGILYTKFSRFDLLRNAGLL